MNQDSALVKEEREKVGLMVRNYKKNLELIKVSNKVRICDVQCESIPNCEDDGKID